jgi:hypothetical protein
VDDAGELELDTNVVPYALISEASVGLLVALMDDEGDTESWTRSAIGDESPFFQPTLALLAEGGRCHARRIRKRSCAKFTNEWALSTLTECWT